MVEYKFDKPVLDPEKMEDWTYNGMKVYNFRRGINSQGYYFETFDTEDYSSWGTRIPESEWTDEIKEFAKTQAIK